MPMDPVVHFEMPVKDKKQVKRNFMQLLSGPDKAKSHRVINAMLKMHKLVVIDLEKAAK